MSLVYFDTFTRQSLNSYILTLLPAGNITFKVYSGTMPSTVGGVTDGQLLATMSDTGQANSTLLFLTIAGLATTNAAQSGRATWCEVTLGTWVFICPVGSSFLELSTYNLVVGQPVSITSFRFKPL